MVMDSCPGRSLAGQTALDGDKARGETVNSASTIDVFSVISLAQCWELGSKVVWRKLKIEIERSDCIDSLASLVFAERMTKQIDWQRRDTDKNNRTELSLKTVKPVKVVEHITRE